ncbi:MAG: gliding motility-associated C-terminal domain-containing protein [Chitinophagales bacterium]
MNKYFLALIFSYFTVSIVWAQTPLCNTNVSICDPGVAGPFNFEAGDAANGAGFDFATGSCLTGTAGMGDNFGFILLNVTSSGSLNLLVDANTSTGFIDVIVFNIPVGQDPCVAVMNPANEIGCNYADFADGCVQFGGTFPCTSTVPAPVVNAGDQLMVIVHDWSNTNTSFNLQLNSSPGSAGSGPPDATITAPATVSEVDPPFNPTTINAGGTWSATCGACIDPSTGQFDPGVSGPGTFDIFYSIGVAPCDAYDTTTIIVTPDCVIPFTAQSISAYEECQTGYLGISLSSVPTTDYVIYFNQAGTAVEGSDYTSIVDSLIIPAGVDTGFISISALEDFMVDNTETVVFDFYNPCTSIVYQSESVNIYELGSFALNVTSDTLCPNSSLSLSSSFSNVFPDLPTYAWTPNNGSVASPSAAASVVTPSSSSTYVLSYQFGSCQGEDSATIVVDSLSLSIAHTLISCPGANDGTLSVSINGGIGTVSGQWTPGGQSALSISNLSAGTYTYTATDESGNSCGTASISYTLVEPAGLNFIYDSTNVSCAGLQDGSITVSGLSPNTNFDVAISYNGFPLPTQTVSSDASGQITQASLPPGLYSPIVITNTNTSCSASFSVEIEEPDTLVANIFVPGNVLCSGGAIDSLLAQVSGGTPAYAYLWSTAETTEVIQNVLVGTYWLQVSDANSCTSSDTIIVSQPAPIVLSLASDSALCQGSASGLAYLSSLSGGVAPFSYTWDAAAGASTNDTAFALVAGSYTLTVEDFNGCVEQASIQVEDGIALLPSETHTNVSCFNGADGSVDLSVSGGHGPYSYQWSGPNGFTSTNEDLSGLVAGNYSVNITDINACPASLSLSISQPNPVQIGFAVADVSCFGGSDGSINASVLSGGTAPFSYQWDANAANQTTALAVGLSEGVYVLNITDGNSCTYSDSAFVSQPLAPLSLQISSSDLTCANANDGSAEVVVSGGTSPYSYLWDDPASQTTAEANSLAAGLVSVLVTDANSCQESISIEIFEPSPVLIDSIISDAVNCWGESNGSLAIVPSGGTGIGYLYSIDGGSSFQSDSIFFNLDAGLYSEILVQDVGASTLCLSNSYAALVDENPYFDLAIAPSDTTLQLEESLTFELLPSNPYTLDDIVAVSWFPETGLSCSDCVDPTLLTYENYTEYTATIFYLGDDSALCSQASSSLIIVENNLELFIPNAFTPDGSNNVNDVFEIYGEGIELSLMQIYNRWGEKIFESEQQNVAWDGTFKGVLQNPGVYTYYVSIQYLDGKVVDRKGSVSLLR